MNKLVIALSGEICSKDSTSLEGFWNGFINIQRSICNIGELQIVAHNMDQQFDNLVKNVYGIDLLSSQSPENNIPTNNAFNLDLANVSSKRKSLMLLENLNVDNETWVLSTSWHSGLYDMQSITLDSSLPLEYLYLPYHDDIDESYSTSWCYSSYESIKLLFKYEEYLIDILSGDSALLNKYVNEPWPLAINKNINVWGSFKKHLFTVLDEKVNFQSVRDFFPIFNQRIDGLEYRLKKIIEKPVITGENSLLNYSDTTVFLSDFGEKISEGSLFKSFILESGLRDKVRFLDQNDFERVNEGQMINPIPFAAVLFTHSRFSVCWEEMLERALKYLPANCCKIYVISEESVETNVSFEKLKDDNVNLLTFKEEDNLVSELRNIFININDEVEYIYFIPDNMPLISNVDAIFLNSLLHFLNNTSENYIQLSGKPFLNEGTTKKCFPSIVKQDNSCPLFTQPAILKSSHLVNQLVQDNVLTSNVGELLTGSNISFSVVCDKLNSGELNDNNRFFPHVHVNIPLRKGGNNEWKRNIEFETHEFQKIK